MTDEEIERALKDRAYDINYGEHGEKWIIPKDKLLQETLAYIDRLKEACRSSIRSFTRMETLYKVKCTELECKQEQVRKETAREILHLLVGHTLEDEGWTWTISKEDVQFIADIYGVEVEE